VDFQNCLTALHIGTIKCHAAVKTTGTQKGGVENIGTVGRSNNDNVGVGVETIHFNEHLIECLLTFIVRTTQTCAALTAYCINFIYKDNTGRVTFGLIEKITDAACTNAYEHFHKFRA